jgi:hypothetical protein
MTVGANEVALLDLLEYTVERPTARQEVCDAVRFCGRITMVELHNPAWVFLSAVSAGRAFFQAIDVSLLPLPVRLSYLFW